MTEGSWPWPEEMDGVLAAPGSHQVLIDNDRVRVLEVSIGPAHREPEHTHRRPSVMIVDGPARIRYYAQVATNSAPKSREEWASKLDSILLRGAPFAVIDNIVGSFASDDFASVLTSAKRTVRIKGLSKVVDVPVNTVWVLNGNDLTLDSDLSQRLSICHLQHEDPSSRKQEKFHIQQKYGCSIEVLLRQERAKYMQACLDLICGWVNDGAPKRKKLVLAKYGEWDGIPPRILLGGNRTADSMVGPAGTKNYGRPSTVAAA